MSRKPETTLILAIHRKLKRNYESPPHFEKMHNPYRGGTADVWYSGVNRDLWMEYKWLPAFPASGIVFPDLSELQMEWLGARCREGRNVAVAVGSPTGILLSQDPHEWIDGMHMREPYTRDELADWIYTEVGACAQFKRFSGHHSLSTGSIVRSPQQSSSASQSTQSTTESGNTSGGTSAELGNEELSVDQLEAARGRVPRKRRRSAAS